MTVTHPATEWTFIYALVDPRTRAVRYVGKANHPRARLRRHGKAQSLASNARKAAWLAELADCGGPTQIVLESVPMDGWEAAERSWITRMRAAGHDLVNLASGGSGCSAHSAEVRGRLSALAIGHGCSLETRAKLSAAQRGRKHDEVTKERMSLAHHGRVVSQETREKLRVLGTGRRHSAESVEKMRRVKIGHPTTLEARARISAAGMGRKHSEETKAKIAASRRGRKFPRTKGHTASRTKERHE